MSAKHPDPENKPDINTDELPFVAPCKTLPLWVAFDWIKLGWHDLKAAPRQSLTYGLIMVLMSYALTAVTIYWGNLGLYLGLVSGFVFAGPWLALTLYSISIHVERGEPVSLRRSITDARKPIGNAMVFATLLTIVFLVWARAANVIYIFFPEIADYHLRDLAVFLGVGCTVGAVFCAIVFGVSAFSLPMLMDRQTDGITAVVTSVNAVLRNKPAMFVWACVIGLCVLIGLLTACLAFLVLLPLLGHATWHAYRDTIDASDWPELKID